MKKYNSYLFQNETSFQRRELFQKVQGGIYKSHSLSGLDSHEETEIAIAELAISQYSNIDWLRQSIFHKSIWKNEGELAYTRTVTFQNGYLHQTTSGNYFGVFFMRNQNTIYTNTYIRVRAGGSSEEDLLKSELAPFLKVMNGANPFNTLIEMSEMNSNGNYYSNMVHIDMKFTYEKDFKK